MNTDKRFKNLLIGMIIGGAITMIMHVGLGVCMWGLDEIKPTMHQPVTPYIYEKSYPQAVQEKLDKNYIVYLIQHDSEEGYYIASIKGGVKEYSIIYDCNPSDPAAKVLTGDNLNYIGDGYKVSKVN